MAFSCYQLRWLYRHAATVSVSSEETGCITESWEASGDFVDEIQEFQRNSVRRIHVYGRMGTDLLLGVLLTEKITALLFRLFLHVCLSNRLLWGLHTFCTKWTHRFITLVVSFCMFQLENRWTVSGQVWYDHFNFPTISGTNTTGAWIFELGTPAPCNICGLC